MTGYYLVRLDTGYLSNICCIYVLTGYDWVLLDPQYLAHVRSPSDRQAWHNFFSQLGVLDLLHVQPETVCLKPEELVRPSCDKIFSTQEL